MFKLSVSYAKSRPVTAPLPLCGDFSKAIREAKELGFQAIEIHGRETEFDAAFISEAKKIMVSEDMHIAALVSGRLYNETLISIADPVEQKRLWAVARLKEYIDAAAELDTDVVLGWIRGRISAELPASLYFEGLDKSMKELDEYALEKGVKLLLEVINRYEVDVFKTAEETLGYIRKNGLKSTYIHLDTFHMNIEETDMIAAIETAGDRLGYVHAADNTRLYPGSGRLDFERILGKLKDAGYEGFVNVECFPVPDGHTAAERAAAFLKKYI